MLLSEKVEQGCPPRGEGLRWHVSICSALRRDGIKLGRQPGEQGVYRERVEPEQADCRCGRTSRRIMDGCRRGGGWVQTGGARYRADGHSVMRAAG